MSNTPTQPDAPPINPDGTPVLTTPSNVGVVGTSSIYDWILPADLGDPNKKIIWYDIKPVPAHRISYAKPVETRPGEISVTNATPVPGSRNVPASTKNQYVSPNDLMTTIAAMQKTDPKGFLAIQTYLSSGVWGTVHVNGTFDHETEVALGNAMLQWLKFTRNTEIPVDFQQYLQDNGSQAINLGNGTSGGGQTAPFQPHLADPATIRAAAQQAFQAAVGKGATEKQLDEFVRQFQAAQTQADKQVYDGTAGGVTAPDLSTEANQFAQQQDPNAYKQYKRQSYVNALVNLFAPPGSGRPDMAQPVPTA